MNSVDATGTVASLLSIVRSRWPLSRARTITSNGRSGFPVSSSNLTADRPSLFGPASRSTNRNRSRCGNTSGGVPCRSNRRSRCGNTSGERSQCPKTAQRRPPRRIAPGPNSCESGYGLIRLRSSRRSRCGNTSGEVRSRPVRCGSGYLTSRFPGRMRLRTRLRSDSQIPIRFQWEAETPRPEFLRIRLRSHPATVSSGHGLIVVADVATLLGKCDHGRSVADQVT